MEKEEYIHSKYGKCTLIEESEEECVVRFDNQIAPGIKELITHKSMLSKYISPHK